MRSYYSNTVCGIDIWLFLFVYRMDKCLVEWIFLFDVWFVVKIYRAKDLACQSYVKNLP